ncbi:MAG: hypothetical protein GF317_07985, partial [Candidatus Lokiarchaeota archaeon]|nr:hypothetical protein [Candidatus Lokiarchaeota archaeon]MBD3199652.1 hypothetical protein [Candidatus Lokiarchaeota archaeon]
SIISQSLFSNDTNILSKFDTMDPAFYKCNIFISASNGITPKMYPYILSGDESKEFDMTFNPFAGFLYYDKELNLNQVNQKSARALEIIRRKFSMDIILVNSSDSHFIPFVGYYPEWDIVLPELVNNLPDDGYWAAFNKERIGGDNYSKNNHLSFSFALINNPTFFKEDIDMGNDQIDFNTGVMRASYLEDYELNEFTDISSVLGENQDLVDSIAPLLGLNESFTFDDSGNLNNSFGNFSLAEDAHYTILEIQYEGAPGSIQKSGNGEYIFNLFDALAYEGSELEPSESIYVNILGALLTQIDIDIICSEVLNTQPYYLQLSSNLLDRLGTILSLIDVEFDIQSLEDYSFQLLWRDFGGIKRNFVNLKNLEDEFDTINFLPALGFQGISSLPTGLLNPLNKFIINYRTSQSEPNILIKSKPVEDNISYGAYRTFDVNITAINVGNETIWGTPTPIPLDLPTIFQILVILEGGNINYADDLRNEIWEQVKIEYPNQYDNLEEFFNFDKDPRIFYFDSSGDGATDYYYPNPFNTTSLYPYNEKMDHIIDILATEPSFFLDLAMTPSEVREALINPYSVWNEDNWKINPNQTLTYISEDLSISNLDSFTKFHSINFTIDNNANPNLQLPRLIYGEEYAGTTPEMALLNDFEDWIIFSEEYYDENAVEIQFLASNETRIDLINNSIDQVSFTLNLTHSLTDIDFEVFNFKEEVFVNMDGFLNSTSNSTLNYLITNNNNSIDWIFQDSQEGDFTVLFKLLRQDAEEFNISINNIDIDLLTRDINSYEMQSNIQYTAKNQLTRYTTYSNSIIFSTEEMASIISHSYLDKYNTKVGYINTYYLEIENIGMSSAKNISINIPIPGIIKNSLGFNIHNNNLVKNIIELAPESTRKYNFSYYTPNSAFINNVDIKYNNTETLSGGNSTGLSSQPNNVYFIAPVDYNINFPFIRQIQLNYNHSNPNPQISDLFNLTLNLHNMGPLGFNISGLSFSSRDKYGDLEPILNTALLNFSNLEYNSIQSINLTLNKTDWKSYYYPPINFIGSIKDRTTQILSSEPIVIGNIDFTIKKEISRYNIEIGDILNVKLTIKNTGSICIKDLRLNDELSFSSNSFSLVDGILVYQIDCINPGEEIEVNYTIRAKIQTIESLTSAKINYYFLNKRVAFSNQNIIKVIIPQSTQYLFITIPLTFAVFIGVIFVWRLRKYKNKQLEIERNEIKILNLESRDSILNFETNIKEEFKKIVDKQN